MLGKLARYMEGAMKGNLGTAAGGTPTRASKISHGRWNEIYQDIPEIIISQRLGKRFLNTKQKIEITNQQITNNKFKKSVELKSVHQISYFQLVCSRVQRVLSSASVVCCCLSLDNILHGVQSTGSSSAAVLWCSYYPSSPVVHDQLTGQMCAVISHRNRCTDRT